MPERTQDDLSIPCYVSYCECECGGMTFACVDEPNMSAERKRNVAKDIAGLIRQGRSVERSTVGQVRAAKWMCQKRAHSAIKHSTTGESNV